MKGIITLIVAMCIAFTFASGAMADEALKLTGPESVAQLEFRELENNKLLISAYDLGGNPVLNLTKDDFTVSRDGKMAQILSLDPLATSQEVSLNIVMVVDNSFSMKMRNAVQPVLSAMENVFKILRPIDNVTLIVFQDQDTMPFGNRNLHVNWKQSSNVDELRTFLKDSFDRGLTEKTYLFEAMLAGILKVREMPSDANKFMIIFSDGEDINSAFKSSVVTGAAAGLSNFEAYAIDYMPGKQLDSFLNSFSKSHGGEAWKAYEADELPSIFEAVSSKMIHRYVLSYYFPPTGNITMVPGVINIEEVTTIETSPMLNYVYFDTGKSIIPDRYKLFNLQKETAGFSENALRGGQEKYLHMLNVIGNRLSQNTNATIRIIGCNSDFGEEKGRTDLSRSRAESVRAYFQYIWSISPERMEVSARNLPEIPSTSRLDLGREENQRVEIRTDYLEILDPVRSTYIDIRSDADSIRILPQIESEYDIVSWEINFLSDEGPVETIVGNGPIQSDMVLSSEAFLPEKLAGYGHLNATVAVTDINGKTFKLESSPVNINFIRREQLRAQNLGYMVEEKYALILFDFDRSDIKERNAVIVNHIVNRIRAIEDVAVNIVGHTDIIGSEDYNIKLSQRRAKAVYDQLLVELGKEKAHIIQYSGVGPFDPLYDNILPENRALNRTVTITLIYQAKD
jgi:outer membrane protein OmpA-like peptidoglycan-associated protein/Mg-chelatase subunit ChlD